MFATTSGRLHQLLASVVLPFVGTIFAQASQAQAVTIRVNAGGPAYTDSAGDVLSADSGFSSGGDTVNWGPIPIAGTSDPTLFQTESYGPNLQCAVSVLLIAGSNDMFDGLAASTPAAPGSAYSPDCHRVRITVAQIPPLTDPAIDALAGPRDERN